MGGGRERGEVGGGRERGKDVEGGRGKECKGEGREEGMK